MAVPKPKAFWPLTITAGVNDRIDFKVGATTYVATIAAGTYYSAADLCVAVWAALSAAYGAYSWGVTVGSITAGRVTIAALVGQTFTLLFGTGANVARSIGPALGFDAADLPTADVQTAQHQHQNGWYADDPVMDDTDELPAYERAVGRAMGGQTKAVDLGGPVYDRIISLGYLAAWKVFKKAEGTSHVNEALERLFDVGWMKFRWFPDAADESSGVDYVLSPETAKSLPRNRLAPAVPLHSLQLRFWKWVA